MCIDLHIGKMLLINDLNGLYDAIHSEEITAFGSVSVKSVKINGMLFFIRAGVLQIKKKLIRPSGPSLSVSSGQEINTTRYLNSTHP